MAEYNGEHQKCSCTNECSNQVILVEVGDADPCGSKDPRAGDMSETAEAPENSHIGINVSSPN